MVIKAARSAENLQEQSSGQHSFSSPYHNTVVSMSDFGAILAALDLFLFLKNRRKIENLARSLD